jgi:death-on-curing family protein
MKKPPKKLSIYQAKNGAIELQFDNKQETFWANLNQIAEVFGVQKAAISKHLKNIYQEKELEKKATVSILETVQKEGKREVSRKIEYYNLDAIISVGYRINSQKATKFRIWATKTLKQHITKGYTINKKVLQKNYQEFLKTVEDIKLLAKNNEQIKSDDILELIKTFSSTWFNLESYDKQNFPKKGKIKNKKVDFEDLAKTLYQEIEILKKDLIQKKEATEMFAQEKNKEALKGILGNVFQSAFGQDIYDTIEEKASHLLYFIIKNHPFTDGNKRTGAFSFIWFLQKMDFDFIGKISPETLTALTLLIAESNPKDKEKIIGLVLLLLKK